MSSIPASSQRSRITPLVIRSAVVAAIGGLIFGFDTAVISGATDTLKDVFHLSEFGKGFLVAIATIGTIFGAIIGGRLADVYGRRKVLFAIGILYVLGSLGTAFAPTHLFLLVFRMIGGIGVGMSSVCAPIYTAEIAPAAVRGRLVGLVQFNIVLGILLAYLSNFIIRITLGGHEWRWMLGVMVIPSAVFLLLLFTVPETPRWLMAHGKPDEAVGISRQLCSTEEESKSQIAEIKAQIAADSQSRASLVEFFSKRYRKVILLAFAIAAFNQLSGINAVLYYAPEIFRMTGASGNTAMLQSVVVGIVNLLATMAGLSIIDRVGRRKLMLAGSIGYLISLGTVSALFLGTGGDFTAGSSILVLVSVLVFIASHAFGEGAVIWVFISEIFPNKVRGKGQALGGFVHWLFAALTSWTFPGIAASLGGGAAFLVFFACMIGLLIWVLRIMPETKQVSLEHMAAALDSPSRRVR